MSVRRPSRWGNLVLSTLIASSSLAGPILASASDSPAPVERITVARDGTDPDADCLSPSASADGQYVAFQSAATNLVSDAAPRGVSQIYVRNRSARTTLLVSRAPGSTGAAGNGDSIHPAISPDGRYVAFESTAINLVQDGQNNGKRHIFVRDLASGRTWRASISQSGQAANADSRYPSVSAAGSEGQVWVAFESDATNLLSQTGDGRCDTSADSKPALTHAFLYYLDPDRANQASYDVRMVSVGLCGFQCPLPGGGFRPSITGNGVFLSFESRSESPEIEVTCPRQAGLVHPFYRFLPRLWEATLECDVGASEFGTADADCRSTVISGDGRAIAFVSAAHNLDRPAYSSLREDRNGLEDVYVWHRSRTDIAQVTERVSVAYTGLAAGRTSGVDANGASDAPSLSEDGRFVAFRSYATNLTPDEIGPGAHVFVRDQDRETTAVASTASPDEDTQPDHPVISASGRWILYEAKTFATAATTAIPSTNIYVAPNPHLAAHLNEIVFPRFARAGSSTSVMVGGENLSEVIFDFGEGIVARPKASILPEEGTFMILEVKIDARAQPGLRDVTMVDPRSGSRTKLANAFAVTPPKGHGKIAVGTLQFGSTSSGQIRTTLAVANHGTGPLTFSLVAFGGISLQVGERSLHDSGPFVVQPNRGMQITVKRGEDLGADQGVGVYSDDPGAAYTRVAAKLGGQE